MPSTDKNLVVIDPKPKDIAVIDPKPRNFAVINSKPQDITVFGPTQSYTDNRTFSKGQIIPLGGFAITYPVAGTWINAPRI